MIARSPGWLFAGMVLAAVSATSLGERTVGILQHEQSAFPGYTLFAPMNSYKTYLVDNDGRLVNEWEATMLPGVSAYLLEDGSLLRTGQPGGNSDFVAGGQAGQVERYN